MAKTGKLENVPGIRSKNPSEENVNQVAKVILGKKPFDQPPLCIVGKYHRTHISERLFVFFVAGLRDVNHDTCPRNNPPSTYSFKPTETYAVWAPLLGWMSATAQVCCR